MNAAVSGDLLLVAAATYSEHVSIHKSLTVQGAGAASTTVDGGGTGVVFDISSVIGGGTVTLDSLTITRGHGPTGPVMGHTSYGGGVYAEGSVVIRNCDIILNSADAGGGVYVFGGPLTLDASRVTANNAGFIGGGIMNDSGTVTINNSQISNNSAGDGGGVENSTLINFPFLPGTVTITNSTLSNNFSSEAGGGISNDGTLTITYSTLSGNTVNGVHGGGAIDNRGTLTLSTSTLSGNSSSTVGGGIYNFETGTAILRNSTVAGNGAAGLGGNLFNEGTLSIGSSIVANSPSGNNCDVQFSASITSVGHNLSSDASCGGGPGDLLNTNPLLGPLGNNGGPTWTHALLCGSPAIDTGDPTGALPTDQRGLPRVWDGDGNGTALIDIGAFEATTGDLNGDGRITLQDVVLALQIAVGIRVPTADQRRAADLNCDGQVTVADALLLLRIAVGL